MKTPTKTTKEGKAKKIKFKKAPDAPKRFKSAFIIFSSEQHKKIKQDLLKEGKAVRTTEIAKKVSENWKALSDEDRKVWEDKAEKDKARYEAEKAMYKGPWKVPSNKRKTKDPDAPKRPASAFLAYSNGRRAALKKENPKATNADLSRMLSKSWKELDATERAVYLAKEKELRDQYKIDIAEWRKKAADEKKAEREEREVAAMEAADDQEANRNMDNDKWVGSGANIKMNQAPSEEAHNLQQQQMLQMNDASSMSQMFPNNAYLQAMAFGGNGMNQGNPGFGMNPMGNNPYLNNAFGGQAYMQGAGNPALSMLGSQPFMQNAGMYGGPNNNFGMGGGVNDGGAPFG